VFKLQQKPENTLVDFKLFSDKDVGLEDWMTEFQIEARGDDDVETDEEIMDNAIKAVSRDFLDARHKVDTMPLNQFVNNTEMPRRVAHPEDYDRCGKFRARYQQVPKLHPSMQVQ
jgi:hypothetical protein